MKEKIARALSVEDGWIWEDLNDNYWSGYFGRADSILTLIREEIKKELLARSEIDREIDKLQKAGIISGFRRREAIAQAQLDKVLKALES